VSEVRIVSSNDSRFEAPTLSAISAWRFEPGRRNGRVVRFRMQIPVDYTLSED
jgi:protein TonB